MKLHLKPISRSPLGTTVCGAISENTIEFNEAKNYTNICLECYKVYQYLNNDGFSLEKKSLPDGLINGETN